MINLIDAGHKRDLRAARTNVVLLTYCVIVGLALVTVILLALFSHWWLANQAAIAESTKAANEAKTSAYAGTKATSAEFTTNLAKIQSVLSNRSHYSTALLNLAAALPPGANLSGVSFSPTFLTSPLNISATTTSNDAATALRDKLAKSPIFASVTLVSVNCGDTGSSCTVLITATLAKSVFTPGATE